MCFNFQPAMQSRAEGRLLTGNSYETHFPASSGNTRQGYNQGWLSLSFSMLLSSLICPPLASLAMLMQWVAAPAVPAPGVILTPISGPGPRPLVTPQHRPMPKKGRTRCLELIRVASGRRVTPGDKANICKHIAIGPVIIIIGVEENTVTTMMSPG